MHTPSEPAPTWTAPRLVAIGTAADSQGGGVTDIIENAFYHITSPV